MDKKIELDKIRKDIEAAKLPLHETAINLVFGKGNIDAPILFIGEAPGEKEDIEGIPFVGRAGKQLDGLLQSIGLGLEDVYIANILKYRPPKNRDPNAEEIETHTPFLIEQIKVIKPKVIATLGNFSTKFVLAGFNTKDMKKIPGIASIHGKPTSVTHGEDTFLVVPLYHPAAMLYRPQLREVLETDFKAMEKEIKGYTNSKPKGLNAYF